MEAVALIRNLDHRIVVEARHCSIESPLIPYQCRQPRNATVVSCSEKIVPEVLVVKICQQTKQLGSVGVMSSNLCQGEIPGREECPVRIFVKLIGNVTEFVPIFLIGIEIFTYSDVRLAEVRAGSCQGEGKAPESLCKLGRVRI
jgi:hypothetical protein